MLPTIYQRKLVSLASELTISLKWLNKSYNVIEGDQNKTYTCLKIVNFLVHPLYSKHQSKCQCWASTHTLDWAEIRTFLPKLELTSSTTTLQHMFSK